MQLSLQGKSRPAFMCLLSPQAAASADPCRAGAAGSDGQHRQHRQHRLRPPQPRSPLALHAQPSLASLSPPLYKAGWKCDPHNNIKRVLVLCVSLGAPFEKLFDLQIMSNKLSKGIFLSK